MGTKESVGMRGTAKVGAVLSAAAMLASGLIVGTSAAADPGERPDRRVAAAVGPETLPAPAGFDMTRAGSPDPKVKQAQQILADFGIPTGSVDGYWGPETARGVCAFRRIAGIGTSRDALDTKTLNTLISYDRKYRYLRDIPASSYLGKHTYLVAQQTCQTIFYVENDRYRRVFPTSTGVSGHRTPNGHYSLGSTIKGWVCSSLYPEGCRNHTEGWFASYSPYGNMYNSRQVVGSIYMHGSMSVPPYPASHGCIRMVVKDADWSYKYIKTGTPVFITGTPF